MNITLVVIITKVITSTNLNPLKILSEEINLPLHTGDSQNSSLIA